MTRMNILMATASIMIGFAQSPAHAQFVVDQFMKMKTDTGAEAQENTNTPPPSASVYSYSFSVTGNPISGARSQHGFPVLPNSNVQAQTNIASVSNPGVPQLPSGGQQQSNALPNFSGYYSGQSLSQ